MLRLTKTEFLRRIKLTDGDPEQLWVAVDFYDMDRYYVANADGGLTPFNELRYKYVIRTTFEELLQTGELDFAGYRKPIQLHTDYAEELYNVHDIKYVSAESMRETTADTPRHIKLGFMQT